MQSLPDLEWKNRVILVFGSSADPRLDQQIELLESKKDEFAYRDIVIIKVADGGALSIYGNASGLNAAALRKEAKLADDRFQVLLVGKDGGVKFRSNRVVKECPCARPNKASAYSQPRISCPSLDRSAYGHVRRSTIS
ncbi:DUF4174 domain-containing protein [Rhizobium sp. XQZ8]|uniref:DUF4174 domain-containing protein n=1 Tax=Rhizobium populisoli TaxID=2859785 RepID=UPI001C683B2F|nr:DUF4174 domain-containing protein [Rhizobium populisoli]MBW6425176.1 DUF4174 domain-containing protein [Rhizobium populisoli]